MLENPSTIFFYLFAAFSILTALVVVLEKRLLRAAFSLILLLCTSAGFYILLGFEYMAGVQVLVYIGGIVVLMLYGIMMTSAGDAFEKEPTTLRKLFAFMTSAAFFVLTIGVFMKTSFPIAENLAQYNTVKDIGTLLLGNKGNGYILPFEVISLLLLSALIGSIVIAKKEKKVEMKETENV